MDRTMFKSLVEMLEIFGIEFFELLDEIDSHKEVTLLRIKTFIDDKARMIR